MRSVDALTAVRELFHAASIWRMGS